MKVSQKKVQTSSADVDPIRHKKLNPVGRNARMPNDEPKHLSNSPTYQPIKFLPSPVSSAGRRKPTPLKPVQHIGPPDSHAWLKAGHSNHSNQYRVYNSQIPGQNGYSFDANLPRHKHSPYLQCGQSPSTGRRESFTPLPPSTVKRAGILGKNATLRRALLHITRLPYNLR
ncbi:Hypothetical predicted protein [Pelobates cultripes]|uniref:Uncharacterized protein n=1 Tax=Pelobates cultripes TaxID=61616 RepID=A0AAD1RT33_PELCU|nr:Hypothetical predicted protein [Pelobates cultripes]